MKFVILSWYLYSNKVIDSESQSGYVCSVDLNIDLNIDLNN